jgi:SPP1 gp7 family putative phage head morphogenesis protein
LSSAGLCELRLTGNGFGELIELRKPKKRRVNPGAFADRVLADFDLLEKRVWMPKTLLALDNLRMAIVGRMSGSRMRRMRKWEREVRAVEGVLEITDEQLDELIEQLFDDRELTALLELQFIPAIEDTVSSALLSTSASTGISFSLGPSKRTLDRLTSRANQLAGEVLQTTYDQVKDVMREGILVGESIPDIAQRIDQVLRDRNPQRATVIARTEVVSAYNGAVYDAGTLNGLIVAYQWIATNDGRTRPSHRHADNQIQLPGQPFQVGSAQLMYPGDPNGPAKEIIQCRCTVAPLTAEEYEAETGQPLV